MSWLLFVSWYRNKAFWYLRASGYWDRIVSMVVSRYLVAFRVLCGSSITLPPVSVSTCFAATVKLVLLGFGASRLIRLISLPENKVVNSLSLFLIFECRF